MFYKFAHQGLVDLDNIKTFKQNALYGPLHISEQIYPQL